MQERRRGGRPQALTRSQQAAGWTVCWGCGAAQNPREGWLCDAARCRATICRRCAPQMTGDMTLWCAVHAPPARIPVLGWPVATTLWHRGRDSMPTAAREGASRLPVTLPASRGQVAALATTEETRSRTVAEVRRLARWASVRGAQMVAQRAEPATVLAEYTWDAVQAGAMHPDPRRRVTRPSTPRTWVRRLVAAVPVLRGAERAAAVTRLLRGLQALAPAASPLVQRGLESEWQRALDAAAEMVRARGATPVAAATWLALELGRLGMRPKPAVRGAMAHSERVRRHVGGATVWEVRVQLDKDNPIGRVGAPRKRWLPSSALTEKVMQLLPVGDSDVPEVLATRKRLLRAQGVNQTYVARRDAAAAMEEAQGPAAVAALLNHRPGSAATPGYAGTTTPTQLLKAMMQTQA